MTSITKLKTAEDLIALAMSPIRNPLLYRQALSSQAEPEPIGADASLTPGNDDSLVLVKLDGFEQIRNRDGSEWAQTLLQSVQILIASLHLKDGSVSQQLTACMGIAGTRDAVRAESVLEAAREALADARSSGPNNIVSQ
jgi:GGDEF domain-containing protein